MTNLDAAAVQGSKGVRPKGSALVILRTAFLRVYRLFRAGRKLFHPKAEGPVDLRNPSEAINHKAARKDHVNGALNRISRCLARYSASGSERGGPKMLRRSNGHQARQLTNPGV